MVVQQEKKSEKIGKKKFQTQESSCFTYFYLTGESSLILEKRKSVPTYQSFKKFWVITKLAVLYVHIGMAITLEV